eukprot:GHVR01147459.1.p1 GENE.GHVR01147459.1~~GHVR01147459.1.p1  ORF type:complete len:289 (+),score=53.90 GHVR01147459.1:632-1498(+)
MVRKAAKEMNIDLSQVVPSGPSGNITMDDLNTYNSKGGGGTPVTATTPRAVVSGQTLEVQLRGFPKAMVKSMNDSLSIPIMNVGEEIDITELSSLLKAFKPQLVEQGSKLTMTSFFIKALSCALNQFPQINSKFNTKSQDSYFQYGNQNVCVAIDTPGGLVVPSVKGVEGLSLLEIQSELLRLQELAQLNKLSPDDLKGGTITVSNVGVIGGTYVKAVNFDGQAAIIAIGRNISVARVDRSGNIVPRQIMNITISADHRHLDGATVARFVNCLKKLLESPQSLLLQMR